MKAKGSTRGPAPERWAQRFQSGDAAQDQLAELMRAGDPVVHFGSDRRARVLRRLRLGGPSRWVGVRFPVLRWTVAALVLMTSGGVITAATLGKWWAPVFHAQDAVTPSAEPARKGRPLRRGKAAPVPGAADQPLTTPDPATVENLALPPPALREESPPSPPAPLPDDHAPPALPAPSVPPPPISSTPVPGATRALALLTPTRRPPARPTLAAPSVPATSPSVPAAPSRARAGASEPSLDAPMPLTTSPPGETAGLQDESRLLGQAVMRLRQHHDARGALATVDDYRSRFPGGTLTREAAIVQVDALLMLKRGDEALEILRGLALQAQGRDQELRLIRGELSAGRDCRGAIADFDRILLQQPPAALMERALQGRAACRLRLGDVDGAVADLDLYLRQYPRGRFAVEARRARALAGAGR